MNAERIRLRSLSTRDLIQEAKASDKAVGVEVTRLYREDEALKAVLDQSFLIEDEQARRKNGR